MRFRLHQAKLPTFGIRKASRAITRFYGKHLSAVGLEPTQFTILVACARQASVSVTKLASRLEIERSALARNLAVMEQRSLVTVKTGQDRRIRLASLTTTGRTLLDEAYPHWLAGHQKLAELFGEDRMAALLGELNALLATTHRE